MPSGNAPAPDRTGRPPASFRQRAAASTAALFGRVDHPLRRTLEYPGDPGVCGPDSASWPLIGDASALVGGIRALLVQSCHPEAAAGVADHSLYRQDPLGRLSRTASYVTAATFGALPEVEEAVGRVRASHARVAGISHRGLPYSAGDPALAAWVHNVLADSFLAAYRAYGPPRSRPYSPSEADRFTAEQAGIGRMFGADPLPLEASALGRWVEDHPGLGPSPGMRSAMEFLAAPPLSPAQKAGYRLLFNGALAVTPPRILDILGSRPLPGARRVCRAAVGFLRWALGASPSWNLALIRVGAPIPDGLFRQPLPVDLPSGRPRPKGRRQDPRLAKNS